MVQLGVRVWGLGPRVQGLGILREGYTRNNGKEHVTYFLFRGVYGLLGCGPPCQCEFLKM